MQQVNLYSAELAPNMPLLGSARLLALAGVAATAVALHAALEAHWSQRALAVAHAAQPADGAPPDGTPAAAPADPTSDLQLRVAQREALRKQLASFDQLPQSPGELLGRVIEALPASMWLTEIDITGARALRIAGGTTEAAALHQFAQALARVPGLQGLPVQTVRLESIEAEADPAPAAQASQAASPLAAAPAAAAWHRFVLASSPGPRAGGP